MDETFWKRCNTCKSEIGFAAPYWVCNVSTCNRPRTALVFCTVECWDSHVPVWRHREAWAIEKRSPTRAEWEGQRAAEEAQAAAAPASSAGSATAPPSAQPAPAPSAPRADATATPDAARAPVSLAAGAPRDILVVASKLKAYIRARSDMNTSDAVLEVLSDRLRALCDQAIRRAAEAGRKTVLDRDF
ncbi:MAG TPA: hypothetical protein VFB01_18645 [Burkholderiales bacterium]|nr:hypothetical protein [Burkholderiales bacterium]